jgi:nitroreductase
MKGSVLMIKEIESRRSIRRYKDIPVKEELIEEILKAGMLAPSSKNRQPWHFNISSIKTFL